MTHRDELLAVAARLLAGILANGCTDYAMGPKQAVDDALEYAEVLIAEVDRRVKTGGMG